MLQIIRPQKFIPHRQSLYVFVMLLLDMLYESLVLEAYASMVYCEENPRSNS